jgi:DNA primase
MQIPRLHPDTIEQVKQRTDIVDVISEHVVLRKGGKGFVGLCPFHQEKSPSFSVSPLSRCITALVAMLVEMQLSF